MPKYLVELPDAARDFKESPVVKIPTTLGELRLTLLGNGPDTGRPMIYATMPEASVNGLTYELSTHGERVEEDDWRFCYTRCRRLDGTNIPFGGGPRKSFERAVREVLLTIATERPAVFRYGERVRLEGDVRILEGKALEKYTELRATLDALEEKKAELARAPKVTVMTPALADVFPSVRGSADVLVLDNGRYA